MEDSDSSCQIKKSRNDKRSENDGRCLTSWRYRLTASCWMNLIPDSRDTPSSSSSPSFLVFDSISSLISSSSSSLMVPVALLFISFISPADLAAAIHGNVSSSGVGVRGPTKSNCIDGTLVSMCCFPFDLISDPHKKWQTDLLWLWTLATCLRNL